MKPPSLLRTPATLALLLLTSLAAPAATNNFVVPAFRGSANSQAGYWEVFTTAFGPPGNLAGPGGNTGAVLTQTGSASAFLTGSGNIYDPVAATAFNLSHTAPSALGTVVLQTRTLGSELDYGGVSLSYTDGAGSHLLQPLGRVELDRGAGISSLWQWDLRGLNVQSYSLSFGAASSSLSFDSLTLDTWDQFQAVPEPSTWTLLGLGLAGLGFRAWRRRVDA